MTPYRKRLVILSIKGSQNFVYAYVGFGWIGPIAPICMMKLHQ